MTAPIGSTLEDVGSLKSQKPIRWTQIHGHSKVKIRWRRWRWHRLRLFFATTVLRSPLHPVVLTMGHVELQMLRTHESLEARSFNSHRDRDEPKATHPSGRTGRAGGGRENFRHRMVRSSCLHSREKGWLSKQRRPLHACSVYGAGALGQYHWLESDRPHRRRLLASHLGKKKSFFFLSIFCPHFAWQAGLGAVGIDSRPCA